MSDNSFHAAAAHARTLQVHAATYRCTDNSIAVHAQVDQASQLKLYGLYKQVSCTAMSAAVAVAFDYDNPGDSWRRNAQ
jgi:hypothetical protein